MAGEAPHHAEPLAKVRGMGAGTRALGAGDGQLRGHRGSPGGLQVGGEVVEVPGVVPELEAERAAEREVVVHGLAKPAHATAPGQGWARARSATRSTLA